MKTEQVAAEKNGAFLVCLVCFFFFLFDCLFIFLGSVCVCQIAQWLPILPHASTSAAH